MKFLTTLIATMSAPAAEGSVKALVKLLAVLIASVLLFSLGFHELMELEGRRYSWWSSIYWTVVTMTTLGYGDITFESDIGRMYSLVVLFAGAILFLILLPFTFIQVVYLPWRAAARQVSAPRSLPAATSGHVVLTELDAVTGALIERLRAADVPYALVVEDVERGVGLRDAGYRVMVGDLDDPETYRQVRAGQAAMLFTSQPDETNTNVVSTWREVTNGGTVVATARSEDAVDILQLVGCDRVLQPEVLLGRAFARRILAPTARSTVVATFGDLLVAEASAAGNELAGRSLGELRLEERFGLTVVGVWERGALQLADPELVVHDSSMLVLVGTEDEIARYDAAAGADGPASVPEGHVIIVGGGRVGRAAGRALRESGSRTCIVERRPERVRDDSDYVVGDAADRDVLQRAGMDDAQAVLITTHDDDTNVYLTLYCRRLRPDVQILGRANSDRNVSTMHRAGADLVLSYASTGAAEVWNALRGETTLLLAEGLLLFRVPVPRRLAGRRLGDVDLRTETGCTVVGIAGEGRTRTDLDATSVIPQGAQLVLVGDDDAEEEFLRRYVAPHGGSPWSRLRRRLAD